MTTPSDDRKSIIPDKMLPITEVAFNDWANDIQGQIDRMRRVITGFSAQLNDVQEAVKAMTNPADDMRDYVDQVADEQLAKHLEKESDTDDNA